MPTYIETMQQPSKFKFPDKEGYEFPTLRVDGVLPPCQETSGMIGDTYIRCGEGSTMLVYYERDARTYPMCERCGRHNVENRGGIQVAALR